MKTEIKKEYIFCQAGVIMLQSSFQQKNFTLFPSPYFRIPNFNGSDKIYKNTNLRSNSLVSHFLLQP